MKQEIKFPLIFFTLLFSITACNFLSINHNSTSDIEVQNIQIDRKSKIPSDAVKMQPANDVNPPVLLSAEFEQPVPLPGLVNTAGAEDSPFIMSDGNTLYFFFTPDVTIPVEEQLLDEVTGIYVSHKIDGMWAEPQRIWLQDEGKLALDGCQFLQGNMMWFCSAREGYEGIHWFRAEYDGQWNNWSEINFDPEYMIGELHLSADGNELYFGSEKPGGQGNLDIWLSEKVADVWQQPINIDVINTADVEGWPALSVDENELWFYRNYGIWRSKKINGEWQAPEQILSTLAGEPSLDQDGNLYFVHHYYVDNVMVEADIYVAYRK